ncbi:hypothetical protein [Thioclava kandeliae]|uniref:Uncharacterized protein n=1 Tax=Thioclava kandeliae TaxID=3070818 RepID=A0ABV1SGF5_9RHOB
MLADICLTFGLLVLVFAAPAGVSAYSEMQPPRFAAVTAVLGGVLVLVAFLIAPEGYGWGDIPDAVARVVAQVLRE